MWIIEWLQGRWNELNDWFGSSYWYFRNIVSSVPSLVSSIYNNIVSYYNNAVSQIQAKINNFYNQYVAPAINYVQSQLNEHGGIIGWLRDSINAAIANAQALLNRVWNDVISWAKSTYDHWITEIAVTLNAFIANHLPEILALLNFRDRVNNWITDVMNRISGIDLSNLKQFYDATKTNVTAFASNPLGFIFDLLWANGINFFCFLLGYGLGATKYTLPPRPNWNTTGGSTGTVIITGSGELANPTAKPYISGYTFAVGHYGIDLGIAMGETIYAAHEGDVIAAEWNDYGYGNMIIIAGGKYWSRYAHLQSYLVSPGMHVQAGQPIALGDSTGNSTGAHLHFELKINGSFVDPVNYLK